MYKNIANKSINSIRTRSSSFGFFFVMFFIKTDKYFEKSLLVLYLRINNLQPMNTPIQSPWQRIVKSSEPNFTTIREVIIWWQDTDLMATGCTDLMATGRTDRASLHKALIINVRIDEYKEAWWEWSTTMRRLCRRRGSTGYYSLWWLWWACFFRVSCTESGNLVFLQSE